MSSLGWGAIVLAGGISLVSPVVIRPLLRKLRILDVPNERSSHSRPTLRGGGIAPLLGIIVGGIWADTNVSVEVALILGAAVLVSLVGLTEDLRGLRIAVRAALQILIGAALAIMLPGDPEFGWVWVPIAALGFAANVNFTNFMDGVNGISCLHGLVAGLAFTALGLVQETPWLTTVGLVIAVSFVAFLPWNLARPGMFLGDVGSYLLGGTLGATSIAAIAAGLNPIAAVAPLSLYWSDTVVTLLHRARRGEPVFQSHRSHVYQRLTNTGLSHLAVAGTMAVFTLAASAVGLLTAASVLSNDLALVLISLLALTYLFLPRLRGDVPSRQTTDKPLAVNLSRPTPARANWCPTRWAVFGGNGFIGSATIKHLQTLGIDTLQLTAPRLELDPRIDDGAYVARLAEANPEMDRLVEQMIGVDVVINAAGQASPDDPVSARLFGANSLLPAVIALAGTRAGVGRVIHLSSAAVQGDRPILDASPDVKPFSPYSSSKALGERAILSLTGRASDTARGTDLVIIRATSVQGAGRPTTELLRRVARSPLASVAAPGDYPTIVSSLDGLVALLYRVGISEASLEPIVLQPWEGLNVREVLELAGGRSPAILPRWICKTVIGFGRAAGNFIPRVAGIVRRVEIMWFGQEQERGSTTLGEHPNPVSISAVLQAREVAE